MIYIYIIFIANKNGLYDMWVYLKMVVLAIRIYGNLTTLWGYNNEIHSQHKQIMGLSS